MFTAADTAGVDYARDLGDPGQFPYTRGIHASGYGGKLWTKPREISGSNASLCTFQVTGPAGECDENQFSVPTVGRDGPRWFAVTADAYRDALTAASMGTHPTITRK